MTVFSNDKNIETLARLIGNLRRYGELRLESLQLDMVSKITMLASALIMGVILAAVVGVVVMFLSFAVIFTLAPLVGGYVTSILIVAGAYLIFAILVFQMRRRWIIDPIARLLVTIFLNSNSEQNTTCSAHDHNGYSNSNQR